MASSLFVFVQDRKMFIQVGYGLEGALPDITAFDITEYKIKPRVSQWRLRRRARHRDRFDLQGDSRRA